MAKHLEDTVKEHMDSDSDVLIANDSTQEIDAEDVHLPYLICTWLVLVGLIVVSTTRTPTQEWSSGRPYHILQLIAAEVPRGIGHEHTAQGR